MPDTPLSLAGRLKDEGLKTQEFFNNMTADQWKSKVYSDGTQWNIHQILTHFVSAEVSFTRLIEDVLKGGEGAPESFDINIFNEEEVYKMRERSVPALIDQYLQARRVNVELVSGLSPDDLQKRGRHPFLGVAPLVDMIKLIYRHNQIHQRDIRKMLAQ
ncbi:MAG: DinB family protein [Anaerolineales bacterium]